MTSTTEPLDLPGVPEPLPEEEPANGDPDEQDEVPDDTLYIAIDGIEYSDLDEDQRDLAYRFLADLFMLDFSLPISDVRLIEDEVGIVEWEMENAPE